MGALRYLAASVPPGMASAGSAVALPILAVQQIHDVAMGGALVAASLGPSVIAAPLAGATLDRVATELGGAVIVIEVGATWIISAALMLAYPRNTQDHTRLPST